MESRATTTEDDATAKSTRRLLPEEREQQIVEKAIEHFTRNGFGEEVAAMPGLVLRLAGAQRLGEPPHMMRRLVGITIDEAGKGR